MYTFVASVSIEIIAVWLCTHTFLRECVRGSIRDCLNEYQLCFDEENGSLIFIRREKHWRNTWLDPLRNVWDHLAYLFSLSCVFSFPPLRWLNVEISCPCFLIHDTQTDQIIGVLVNQNYTSDKKKSDEADVSHLYVCTTEQKTNIQVTLQKYIQVSSSAFWEGGAFS